MLSTARSLNVRVSYISEVMRRTVSQSLTEVEGEDIKYFTGI